MIFPSPFSLDIVVPPPVEATPPAVTALTAVFGLILVGVLVCAVIAATVAVLLIVFGAKKAKKPVTVAKENESTDDTLDKSI